MKTIRYITILSILFATIGVLPASSSAQDNEILLKDIQVDAIVDFNSSSKIYRYDYKISNGKNSTGRIDSFVVSVRSPEGGARLSDEGLSRGTPDTTAFLPDELRLAMEKFKDALPPIVPIYLSSPSNWVSIILGTARWGSEERTIGPGESLSGFVIESPGLPTIREFHADPKVNDPPARREIVFQGKTIGPTAPPSQMDYEEFIGNLVSLGKEANKLGWIKDGTLLDAVEGDLKKATNAIGVFKKAEAKDAVSSLLTKVEAAKESGLTPEGYALLKYNLQYLLQKL